MYVYTQPDVSFVQAFETRADVFAHLTTCSVAWCSVWYSELRIDCRTNLVCVNMASKYVRMLRGAQMCCGSNNNNVASRKTEVSLASTIYS